MSNIQATLINMMDPAGKFVGADRCIDEEVPSVSYEEVARMQSESSQQAESSVEAEDTCPAKKANSNQPTNEKAGQDDSVKDKDAETSQSVVVNNAALLESILKPSYAKEPEQAIQGIDPQSLENVSAVALKNKVTVIDVTVPQVAQEADGVVETGVQPVIDLENVSAKKSEEFSKIISTQTDQIVTDASKPITVAAEGTGQTQAIEPLKKIDVSEVMKQISSQQQPQPQPQLQPQQEGAELKSKKTTQQTDLIQPSVKVATNQQNVSAENVEIKTRPVEFRSILNEGVQAGNAIGQTAVEISQISEGRFEQVMVEGVQAVSNGQSSQQISAVVSQSQVSQVQAELNPSELDVSSQVAVAMRNVRLTSSSQTQEMTLRLDPPDMGSVRVTMKMTDGEIHGVVLVEKAGTFLQMHRETPALIERLNEANIPVRRIEVMLNNDAANQSGSNQQDLDQARGGFGSEGQSGDAQQSEGQEDSEVLNTDQPQEVSSTHGISDGSINMWI